MFKSQLEPPSENFVETQIFVENIFDTVKKAREAKAARSLAESKLAHYDYSFDFSPSKRKKTRKNAKNKQSKVNSKSKSVTPKKKPRKPRTPKDSSEKKKKQQQSPTTPKTPRKYTKRAKVPVKPQNDIDDEEAAFILSSISQRSFDSFYNRLNGSSQPVSKIQIPLETVVQPQPVPVVVKQEPNHVAAYHHVLLDHNYWIVEPRVPEPQPVKEPSPEKSNMNLLLSVGANELSTGTNKTEVNNNKLPVLDESPQPNNAVKKRWLRQATTECPATVTPPETSPNSDMTKAPLKKRLTAREIDDEIKTEPVEVNGGNVSVIQSPIGHAHVPMKNNLTFGIQMSSPVDVNAIYGRSHVENMVKVEEHREQVLNRNIHGNELKPHNIYDEKLIKLEPDTTHYAHHDHLRSNNVNIVEVKFNEKLPQSYGIKQEVYDNIKTEVKMEPEKVITVDGKLQQILDGKIQRIYRDNSHYFVDNGSDKFYSHKLSEPVSVIQSGINVPESPLKYQNNHIIIQHQGTAQNDSKSSSTKIGQLKGFASPTKIQISPTRTYEIYTKNPHENIAESLLKLQQESPVKLLQMSPAKVIQSPSNYQIPLESSVDHGHLKVPEKKLKKTPKAAQNAKIKPVKPKKTPTKTKKSQQKPKKVKVPKSPSKAAKAKKSPVKIDKNLMKNFTNLEDVPLKIRQNLAMNEDILMKFKGTESMDVKHTVPAISNFNHLIPQFEPQNLICNKIFNEIEKGSKRTASESSSGSSKGGKRHADAIKSPTKSASKKLKFDESGSERSTVDDCEMRIRNLMEGIASAGNGIAGSGANQDKPHTMSINNYNSQLTLESPKKSINSFASPRKLDFDNITPTDTQNLAQLDMTSIKKFNSESVTAHPSILTGITPFGSKFPDLAKLSSKADEYSDSDTDTAESEGSDSEERKQDVVNKKASKVQVMNHFVDAKINSIGSGMKLLTGRNLVPDKPTNISEPKNSSILLPEKPFGNSAAEISRIINNCITKNSTIISSDRVDGHDMPIKVPETADYKAASEIISTKKIMVNGSAFGDLETFSTKRAVPKKNQLEVHSKTPKLIVQDPADKIKSEPSAKNDIQVDSKATVNKTATKESTAVKELKKAQENLECEKNLEKSKIEALELSKHVSQLLKSANEVGFNFPPYKLEVESKSAVEASGSLEAGLKNDKCLMEIKASRIESGDTISNVGAEESTVKSTECGTSAANFSKGTAESAIKSENSVIKTLDSVTKAEDLIKIAEYSVSKSEQSATKVLESATKAEKLAEKDEKLDKMDEKLAMKDDKLAIKDKKLTNKDEKLTIRDEKLSIKDDKLSIKDDRLAKKGEKLTIKDKKLAKNVKNAEIIAESAVKATDLDITPTLVEESATKAIKPFKTVELIIKFSESTLDVKEPFESAKESVANATSVSESITNCTDSATKSSELGLKTQDSATKQESSVTNLEDSSKKLEDSSKKLQDPATKPLESTEKILSASQDPEVATPEPINDKSSAQEAPKSPASQDSQEPTPPKPELDILNSIESIKSVIDSTTVLESPLKPVVEQQVASILEKVIPKTLKTDFAKELELDKQTEADPLPTDPADDIDDEDVTVYRETVEEFHKDTLEKLITANKRFCRESVHNPFRHDGSGRNYSKSRSYDYDDHRKKGNFDSHGQFQHHPYQRSNSEVYHDPRKERWCGNGIYENRNYGSFHYDKIHHREPITTTYSMYRAQKASQIDTRWNQRASYEYQQEPVKVAPEPVLQPQPAVINTYRPPPAPIHVPVEVPPVMAVSPQAEALKNATSDAFGGFLKDKLGVGPAAMPKTKTASSDPRLNPSLVQDVKKDEPATPKKKLSLDQYRKRKSLTSVTQSSPSDDIIPSISVSITDSSSPTLSPAFDPTIAAAAATG